MAPLPAVPGAPKAGLPSFLQRKQVGMTRYADMMISAPVPIRATINKQGRIEFTGPDGVNVDPVNEINGVIMAFARPRSYWKEKGSTKGKAPDCSSSDGVNGKGKHIVKIGETALVPLEDGTYPTNDTDAVMVIERPCSTCPHAQWESGDGNAQACKQNVRLGIYVPTYYPTAVDDQGNPTEWSEASINEWWSKANNEEDPATAPPLIFNISPTGIKEFEAYLRWMQDGGAPMEAYWCTITGGTKAAGQWTVGVPKFAGEMMDETGEWFFDKAMSLKSHAVVKDIKAPGTEHDYVVE